MESHDCEAVANFFCALLEATVLKGFRYKAETCLGLRRPLPAVSPHLRLMDEPTDDGSRYTAGRSPRHAAAQ